MQRLQEHRWLRALLMWGLLQVILYCCHYLPLPTVPAIVVQGVLLVGIFAFLDRRLFRIFPEFYSRNIPFWKQLGAAAPLFVYILFFNVTGVFSIRPENIGLSLIVSLEAAIMEEYICRGLLLGGLLKDSQQRGRDIWLAVIGSSFIFGLAHLQNITHQPLDYTLFQITAATLMGIFYGAIYVRSQSLLWVMLGHFMQDFVAIGIQGLEAPTIPDNAWLALPLLAFIFLPVALWLLRPKKHAVIAAGFSR